MRLPQPRFAVLTALTLALAFPTATQAAYGGGPPSDYDRQRRLESEGQKLRDSIRSQRNTPSPRSNSESTSAWLDRMQAANEARDAARQSAADQRRAEADWRRDHPHESPAQFYARIEREAAANAAYEARLRAEAAIKAREDFERMVWTQYRNERLGYAARSRPPGFATATAALAWSRAHHAQAPNVWAAVKAAVLLADGVGAPPDIAAAAALVDPAINRDYDAQARSRYEPAALFAYLQATHGDTFPALKHADPLAPRRRLETLATQSDFAKWCLARLLAESPDPADHAQALALLPAGLEWADTGYTEFIEFSDTGRTDVQRHVDAIATHILARTATGLPAALQTWTRKNIERLTHPVLSAPPSFRPYALDCFAEAAAQRFIPGTPAQSFPYESFDPLLSAACREGSSAADAIALLQRHELIGRAPFTARTPEWMLRTEPELALPALTRWATRADILGTRTRILLAALAAQTSRADPVTAMQTEARALMIAESDLVSALWADARAGLQSSSSATLAALAAKSVPLQAYYDALARLETNAPAVDAVPGLLAAVSTNVQLYRGLSQLNRVALEPAQIALLYAVEDPAFDMAQAAARLAAAYGRGVSAPARRLAFIDAIRLGDAFAPALLAQEYDDDRFTDALTSSAKKELRANSAARRARDEATGHPRALAARLVEARFEERAELKPVFDQAIAAGSILAARARLSRRIDAAISRQNDQPLSSGMPPELIAELDAAVAELSARPDRFNEWSLFPHFLSTDETTRVAYWFHGFDLWAKDREQRLADAELIRVIQPQIDAVIATLSGWPGFDPYDAQRSAQLEEARQLGYKANELVTTDGTEALVLFLQAAGLGDRVALDRLAGHIRLGTGQLPRSAEFADRLIAAELKMLQGDAEVGDANAASLLGSALIYGRSIAKDRAAGLDWLRYAAGLGDRDAASKLAGQAGERGDNNPAEARHWSAVGEGIQYGEMLLVLPRRLQGGVVDLTPVRPALEAALTDASRYLANPPAKSVIEAADEAESARHSAALDLFQTDRAAGLTALAQSAARGDQYSAFATAQIVGGGRFGPQPELARRFHALGILLLQIAAEQGDFITAHRLGLHHLELLEKRDPVAAIHWFTYAAELGYGPSADYLAQLYTTGAPDIPIDSAAAARWTAFGETTMAANFKPRAPLR